MPKPPKHATPKETSADGVPEWMRDSAFIGDPITVTAFRRRVLQRLAKLDLPGNEIQVELTVIYDDDEEQWYVFSLRLDSADDEPRHLLFAMAPTGRATPFITKRNRQKGYRTLETLIRQMTDIFGERTILNVRFNAERRYDLMTGPQVVAPERES